MGSCFVDLEKAYYCVPQHFLGEVTAGVQGIWVAILCDLVFIWLQWELSLHSWKSGLKGGCQTVWGVSYLHFCLWFSGIGYQDAARARGNIPLICRWCCSLCIIWSWPLTCTWTFICWVWRGWDQHVQFWGPDTIVLSQKREGCSLNVKVPSETLPLVEEFKYLGIIFMSAIKRDFEID